MLLLLGVILILSSTGCAPSPPPKTISVAPVPEYEVLSVSAGILPGPLRELSEMEMREFLFALRSCSWELYPGPEVDAPRIFVIQPRFGTSYAVYSETARLYRPGEFCQLDYFVGFRVRQMAERPE